MAALDWPSILKPSSEAWNFNAGASRGAPASLTGVEQAITAPTGRVTASLTVPCNTPERVLAMRALLAGLDGRAGTVIVGPCEAGRRPASPATFRLAATASVNATSLQIERRSAGGLVRPGNVLGLGGSRLYTITRFSTPDTGAPGIFTVIIRPWIRIGRNALTGVDFNTPRCEMQLASDDVGAIELSLSRRGVVTLDLVEAPPPSA